MSGRPPVRIALAALAVLAVAGGAHALTTRPAAEAALPQRATHTPSAGIATKEERLEAERRARAKPQPFKEPPAPPVVERGRYDPSDAALYSDAVHEPDSSLVDADSTISTVWAGVVGADRWRLLAGNARSNPSTGLLTAERVARYGEPALAR